MTAPRTRIAEGATEFERELLRSWQREQPSPAARQATLALMGGVAPTGVAAGLKAASGSMAPKAATLGAALLGKWAIVGAGVVALATAGTAVYSVRSSSTSTPVTVAPPVAFEPPVAASVPQLPPSATAEASSAAAPPLPTAAKTPPAAPSALEPPRALGLGQEVAALDRARDALAAGNAAGAIRQVDEYESQFPRGALAQEATALRIEALLQQGNRDAAVRLADRFLASNPKSPHAARIRLLVQRAH
jgi:hypothetical protein